MEVILRQMENIAFIKLFIFSHIQDSLNKKYLKSIFYANLKYFIKGDSLSFKQSCLFF